MLSTMHVLSDFCVTVYTTQALVPGMCARPELRVELGASDRLEHIMVTLCHQNPTNFTKTISLRLGKLQIDAAFLHHCCHGIVMPSQLLLYQRHA